MLLMRTTAELERVQGAKNDLRQGRLRTQRESSGASKSLLLSSIFIPRTCFIVGVRVGSMLFLLCYVFQIENSTVAGARYDVLASARLLDAFVPYRRLATISTSINGITLKASGIFQKFPLRIPQVAAEETNIRGIDAWQRWQAEQEKRLGAEEVYTFNGSEWET